MQATCSSAILLMAIAFMSASCGRGSDGARPDVLLVTIDTLRADHCSLYGYERATTPHLDRLAAEGVTFESAYAPMATTAPSLATLMTSLYPLAHGVTRNAWVLADAHETLAERLARAGYITGAFISSIVLAHDFGLAQGFAHYDDDLRGADSTLKLKEWHGVKVPGGNTDRRADQTTERALGWLSSARQDERRLFLWVHYMDPHEPYTPPSGTGDPFGAAESSRDSLAHLVARYDTEILFTDTQLGRLVDAFEAGSGARGALLVVAADHGEGFLDHGWRGHGPQIYEEAVRVPLVFRWSGTIPGGVVVRRPAGLQDIAPTLFELLGIDAGDGAFPGRNLAGDWGEEPVSSAESPLFFQRTTYERDGVVEPIRLWELDRRTFGSGVRVRGEQFGVRLGPWKYIEAPEEIAPRQLYDLREDPRERLNLSSMHTDIAGRLSTRLAEWRATQEAGQLPLPERSVTPAERRALETLGYLEPETEP